jgi:hypothetical protein
MTPVDQRERLKGKPFSYRAARDGSVRIEYEGKTVKTLADASAARFLARVDGADELAVQLLMAKATGNFKRGNERR